MTERDMKTPFTDTELLRLQVVEKELEALKARMEWLQHELTLLNRERKAQKPTLSDMEKIISNITEDDISALKCLSAEVWENRHVKDHTH